MSLAKKATLSVVWSISSSVVTRVLGLVGTLLLVKFVVPEAYAEVTAASVLVQTAHQFTALGVGLYLVTNPTSGAAAAFQAQVVHVALGAIALAGVFLFRQPLEVALGGHGLAVFVPGLALAMFIERLSQVPEKLLVRQLRFGVISVSRTMGDVAYTGVSVALAMSGWGAMAVVWGNVARAILRTGIILAFVPAREWGTPHRIDPVLLRRMLSFGVAISIGAFAVFAAKRWDNLAMIALFGESTAGLYVLAYNLAGLPAAQIGEQISDVLVASFPKLAPEKRYDALVRAIRILGLIIVPMAVGLGVVAEPLAAVFLDESMGWQGVAPYLAVLSLLSIPYPLCGVIFAYMQSYNRSWAWSAIEWVGVALLLGTMFLLGQIGPLWAASAAVIGFAARYVLFLLWLKHKDGTKVGPLVVSLGPPILASAIMVAGVLGARALLDQVGLRSDLLQLIVEIVVGALVYPPVAFLLAPVASRDLLGLAGRVLRRRRKAQPNVDPETDEAA